MRHPVGAISFYFLETYMITDKILQLEFRICFCSQKPFRLYDKINWLFVNLAESKFLLLIAFCLNLHNFQTQYRTLGIHIVFSGTRNMELNISSICIWVQRYCFQLYNANFLSSATPVMTMIVIVIVHVNTITASLNSD